MQEQLISFKVAKLAKEKGFDLECKDYYEDEMLEESANRFVENWNNDKESSKRLTFCKDEPEIHICYSAPTQSLLQKWMREVHNIHVEARKSVVSKQYFWRIVEWDKLTDWKLRPDSRYNSYETALEAGLYEALTLIKNE